MYVDINFFEPIKKKNKKKINAFGLLYFAAVSAAFTLVVILYIFKREEYKNLINDKTAIETHMNRQDFQDQLRIVSEKEDELQVIRKGASYLNQLAISIPQYHTVREEVVRALQNELTNSIYFESLRITQKELALDGYSKNVFDIAQFEYNLNHCGLFKDVVVNAVKEEFAVYLLSGAEIIQVDYEYKFTVQLNILETNLLMRINNMLNEIDMLNEINMLNEIDMLNEMEQDQ